ncbi:MAG: hypothetical protein ACJA0Z_003780 [Halioglobus sp.]|jgi:hypothetical protein
MRLLKILKQSVSNKDIQTDQNPQLSKVIVGDAANDSVELSSIESGVDLNQTKMKPRRRYSRSWLLRTRANMIFRR